jgi:DNA-binding transcriptional ArsR family regulator
VGIADPARRHGGRFGQDEARARALHVVVPHERVGDATRAARAVARERRHHDAVWQLLAAEGQEIACGGFEHCLTKATFSHHIAILEKAGLVQARPDGTRRLISLRHEHVARKYPGLIELIRQAP